jgi:DNA-directed RNA polymerase subunit RPC12/RpoP
MMVATCPYCGSSRLRVHFTERRAAGVQVENGDLSYDLDVLDELVDTIGDEEYFCDDCGACQISPRITTKEEHTR